MLYIVQYEKLKNPEKFKTYLIQCVLYPFLFLNVIGKT